MRPSPSKKARTLSVGSRSTESVESILMQPTEERPWMVRVLSLLPEALPSSSSSSLQVCRSGKWMCSLVQDDATNQYVIYIWHESSSQLDQQKFETRVLTLTNPKWDAPQAGKLLLSLQHWNNHPEIQQQHYRTNDIVHLYIASPHSGVLYLHKFTTADTTAPRATSFVYLNLLDADESPTQKKEIITSLTVHAKTAYVGSSAGRSFLIPTVRDTLQHVATTPVALSSAAQRRGFLSSLFGSTQDHATSVHFSPHVSESLQHDSVWKHVLAVGGGTTTSSSSSSESTTTPVNNNQQSILYRARSFVSVTQSGVLIWWHVQPDNTTTAVVEPAPSGQAVASVSLLQAVFKDTSLDITDLQVLQAAAGPASVIHVVARVTLAIGEQRLYWIRCTCSHSAAEGSMVWKMMTVTWLDRFANVGGVEVMGLVVAENGVGHAALAVPTLTNSSRIPILMAHDAHHAHCYEVDLYPILGSDDATENNQDASNKNDGMIWGLYPDDDHRTFGCTLATSAKMCLRAECSTATEEAALAQSSSSPRASTRRNPHKIAALLNHLRSTFWNDYQHPDRDDMDLTAAMPPSLQRAEQSDLETAIWKLGQELQKTLSSTSASPNSVMTHHLAYVSFLQRSGMYRSLMSLTKWRLMAIGQEIAAFQAIVSYRGSGHERLESYLSTLVPHDVDVWLEGVQVDIFAAPRLDHEAHRLFCGWLQSAMTAAMDFRSERCTVNYDIAATAKPPVANPLPVFTSRTLVQNVLKRQLLEWNALSDEHGVGSLADFATEIEAVVTATLRAHGDVHLATQSQPAQSQASKKLYHQMQSLSINFFRKVLGLERDDVAWDLSKEHNYFYGLCKIALDHRKEGSHSEFDLIPLFKKLEKVTELDTGLSFGKYVIKWHLERNHVGLALEYGKYCESDLTQMLHSEPELRPYRWIVSVQRGDYESATTNLVETVEDSETIRFQQAKFNMAMAKITNKIVGKISVSRRALASDRNKKIENTREILQAQQQLLSPEELKDSTPWSAAALLARALEKAQAVQSIDEKADALFVALVLCAAMDDSSTVAIDKKRQAAAEVWSKAVEEDWSMLSSILNRGHHLSNTNVLTAKTKHTVSTSSIFGRLVFLCGDCQSSSWEHVNIDSMMESFVLEKFGGASVDQASLQRLLRAIATVDEYEA